MLSRYRVCRLLPYASTMWCHAPSLTAPVVTIDVAPAGIQNWACNFPDVPIYNAGTYPVPEVEALLTIRSCTYDSSTSFVAVVLNHILAVIGNNPLNTCLFGFPPWVRSTSDDDPSNEPAVADEPGRGPAAPNVTFR